MNRYLVASYVCVAFAAASANAQQPPEGDHGSHEHRDSRSLERPQSTLPQKRETTQLEGIDKMQPLLREIERTQDPTEKKRLLKEHLQMLRHELDAVAVAPPAMGVATLKEDGRGGGEHTIVFGEGFNCQGTLAMHKVITERLAVLEGIVLQMIQREAFDADARGEPP